MSQVKKRKEVSEDSAGVKKGKRKTQPIVQSPTSFGSLYGVAVFRICYLWTFNNGNDGDWPPRRHVVAQNDEWMLIFQPKREDDMPSFREACLMFARVDKSAITGKQMQSIEADVKQVHALLVQSFNEAYTANGNVWFSSVQGHDPTGLLNLVKPLALSDDRKNVRLTFQYAGITETEDFNDHYWYPMRLGEWLGWDKAFDVDEPLLLPFRHRVRSDETEMRVWMSDMKEILSSES